MTLGLTKVIWVMASVFLTVTMKYSALKYEKKCNCSQKEMFFDIFSNGAASFGVKKIFQKLLIFASVIVIIMYVFINTALFFPVFGALCYALASRARAENKIKDSSNFNICSKKTLTLAVKHTRLKYNTYYCLGHGLDTVLFLMFFLLSLKKHNL